jgi:benzoate-CoA ligase
LSTANAAVELLSRNLALHPDKVAYFCGDRALTYQELDRASRGAARLIQNEGIAPGERVVIALPDSLAFPAVFLGCLISGAVAVAVGADLSDEELSFIIEDSGARLIVTHEGSNLPGYCTGGIRVVPCGDGAPLQWSGAGDPLVHPHQPSADDIAYILYSSGSTGRPKGVPHRHRSLLLPCQLVGRAIFGITDDDVIFSTSKLSFTYGLINSLAFPLFFGATAILLPGKPEPETILGIVGQRRPTIFFSVPSIYNRIVLSCTEPQLKLPMRLCCSAGEALPAPLFAEWQRLTGLEIIDGIGCTEMTYHFICNIPGQALPGSAGRVVHGYRARLVDDNGDDVSEGSEGNLLIKGETMSPFYWNQPGKGSETMGSNGFLKTGDIFVEREGFYYHRGRSDDMIKVDALWVSPVLVEEVLRGHPAVADCAVAAVSVGTLVRPGAFVVLNPGNEETSTLVQELKAHVASRLPVHMRPVRYRFMAELPRTATGKVQRFRLKEKN